MMDTVFSIRLRKARKFYGFTQKQFAERIGLTPSSIVAYEANRKCPRLSTALCICDELQCPMEWLFGTKEEREKLSVSGAVTQNAPWANK